MINMAITEINTDDAPMAVGPYSQAIEAGNMVFTAGEIPVEPKSGEIPETIDEQAKLALSNLMAIFDAAGVERNRIVSVTVYLKNIEDFSKVNLVYADFFVKPYPARSCVAVAALPKGVGIMVSGIGVKN